MDAMRTLAMRDDVLSFLFWASNERIFAHVTADEIKKYLNEDREQIGLVLHHLQESGFLLSDAVGRLSLTDVGYRTAAVCFREEFQDFTGRSHGECSDDCACHQTGWDNCLGR